MSTIYTIRDNLKNTIIGKEALLDRSRARLTQRPVPDDVTWFAIKSTVEFLEININELKVILFDVEKACEEYSLMGWQINPERMGQ